MKSTILFVLLFTATYAQQEETAAAPERPVRAPQGHIQYSDPDGLKVSWKLYAPYSQWKSHLENPLRNQRGESGTGQPTALGPHQQSEFVKPAPLATPAPAAEPKPVQPIHQVQVQYKPYSMVPTHIKQLILEMYEPQGPYVDPSVYIYRAHSQQQQQQQDEQQQEQAQEKSQAESQEETAQTSSQPQLGSYSSRPQFEHIPKYPTKYPISKTKIGFVQYREEQPTAAASAAPQYGAVPERREAVAEESSQPQQQQHYHQQQREADDGMPKELHQLLNLQAMTPYHVIANRILYKPKSIFVPKPLSEETKGPYKYRSKVYFLKNDRESEEKDVKERPEREEPVEREERSEREDRIEREDSQEQLRQE